MPRFTLLLLVAILGSTASLQAQLPVGPTPNNAGGGSNLAPIRSCQVIARIDGQPVLASEVLWRVNVMLEDNKGRIPPDKVDEVRNMLMRNNLAGLIDMKLLYADFKRQTAGKADMNGIRKQLQKPFEESEVPKLMKMLNVDNTEDLKQELSRFGTSLREQRDAFIEQAIAGEWIRQSVTTEKATHADLVSRYQQNLAKYEYPSQVRWEEMFISYASHPEKAHAKNELAYLGNQLWQKYTANRDPSKPIFADIAQQHSDGLNASDGGLHDWTSKGALRDQAVDKALFTLPVGTMSPIIEGMHGYHIVRVIERKEAGRTPFHELQNDLRAEIDRERKDAAIEALIAKTRRNGRVWTIFTGDTTAQAFLNSAELPMQR